MPAGPMDALGTFTYLTDNVPDWISRIADLTSHTTAKHAEYTEAYKNYASPVKPRRRKNSSVCSIHTADLKKDGATDQIQNQEQQDANNEETVDAVPNTTGSLVSTRHNVIIHYDGHTQHCLEDMVRYIGTARNNIRRGRMAQMPPMGFRSRMPPMLKHGDGGASPDLMLSNIRSARNCGPPGPRQGVTAFDLADKHLEVAHGLCESAAYQFLRSGVCKTDLDGVDKNLKTLLGMAGAEVQLLSETRAQTPSEPESKSKMEAEEKSKPRSPSSPSATVEPTNKPQVSPNGSATGHIEVDDADSVSVESVDLTAFRANRMNRMRP